MPTQRSEAARAIDCFERLHQLEVTVHDLDGQLRGQVGVERLSHRQARCRAAKAAGVDRCIAFDVELMRREAPRHVAGLRRRCPFGVREAVVPCLRDGRLAWVLFAGPLPEDEARAEDALEGLRQLAARLRLWEEAHRAWPRAPRVERAGAGAPSDRRGHILRWIEVHHTEDLGLDDLAAELGLSRFQASRAVRAACEQSFSQLLTAARLATARALLRETTVPIVDVALRSGFGDRSHFHRVFRAHCASSPQAYRAQAGEGP